ncbi:MAG TPA: ribonucleotide reductase N-terminal alpha domain-containing protein, partial [Thermaerobacter sp.]
MELTGIRKTVFLDRYAKKGPDGKPVESSPEEMWDRVARAIAEIEEPGKREEWERKFRQALDGFKFVPGGRILAGAGTGHKVTYYNCYVIPSPEDSRKGIMENVSLMVEIMSRGGGVGVNLSTLRPRGTYVRGVNGTASGPVSWAEVYSTATGSVIQGGSRRGALMLMLDDDHPDIEEFITVKRDLTKITNANLSVCISDAFMEAVQQDLPWDLKWNG